MYGDFSFWYHLTEVQKRLVLIIITFLHYINKLTIVLEVTIELDDIIMIKSSL